MVFSSFNLYILFETSGTLIFVQLVSYVLGWQRYVFKIDNTSDHTKYCSNTVFC